MKYLRTNAGIKVGKTKMLRYIAWACTTISLLSLFLYGFLDIALWTPTTGEDPLRPVVIFLFHILSIGGGPAYESYRRLR